MPDRPNLPDIAGLLLQITGLLTESAISGIRNFLYDSLTWLGTQAESISDYPAIQNTEAARQLRKTGDSLKEAGGVSFEAIYLGIHRSAEMLTETLQKLQVLHPEALATLGRNLAPESILGDSFLAAENPWAAQTSFRRMTGEGRQAIDASVTEIIEDFRASGLRRPLICIPGLLQDETLWCAGRPLPLAELFRDEGYYPVFVRLNPTRHLPELGLEIAPLLEALTDALGPAERASMISFSHGGLILRSALIAGRARGMRFTRQIDRAVLISSPDGGTFVEKTGFLFGFGFREVPGRALRFMSLVGGRQSPAFRDLATAAIRNEDLGKPGPVFASSPDRYHGEFEDISPYQIYSLVSDSNHIWSHWLGDGLVEESSLTMLSDLAFRSRPDADERIHCLIGPSHFQLLQSETLQPVLRRVLHQTEPASDRSPSR